MNLSAKIFSLLLSLCLLSGCSNITSIVNAEESQVNISKAHLFKPRESQLLLGYPVEVRNEKTLRQLVTVEDKSKFVKTYRRLNNKDYSEIWIILFSRSCRGPVQINVKASAKPHDEVEFDAVYGEQNCVSDQPWVGLVGVNR